MGPKIFICYRSAPDGLAAQLVYDRLLNRFKPEYEVFFDVDRIAPGGRWATQIRETISGCGAMVVMIGRDFASLERSGRRRLHLPDDWVRREIETAIATKVCLFPVLLEDAKMPERSELPQSIHRLTDFQAISLQHGPLLDKTLDRLFAGIKQHLELSHEERERKWDDEALKAERIENEAKVVQRQRGFEAAELAKRVREEREREAASALAARRAREQAETDAATKIEEERRRRGESEARLALERAKEPEKPNAEKTYAAERAIWEERQRAAVEEARKFREEEEKRAEGARGVLLAAANWELRSHYLKYRPAGLQEKDDERRSAAQGYSVTVFLLLPISLTLAVQLIPLPGWCPQPVRWLALAPIWPLALALGSLLTPEFLCEGNVGWYLGIIQVSISCIASFFLSAQETAFYCSVLGFLFVIEALRLTDLGPLPWYLYPLSFETRLSWRFKRRLLDATRILAVVSLCSYFSLSYMFHDKARLHDLSSKYAAIVAGAHGELSQPPHLEADGRLRIKVVLRCPELASRLVEQIKSADPQRSEVVAQILVQGEGTVPCGQLAPK
jgi:hypothetical protein